MTETKFDPFRELAELAIRKGLSMGVDDGYPAFAKEGAPSGRFGLPSSRPNSSSAKKAALKIARS